MLSIITVTQFCESLVLWAILPGPEVLAITTVEFVSISEESESLALTVFLIPAFETLLWSVATT